MNIVGIIPARMASTRFPGKPLALIHGTPMIGHIYHRCKMSKLLTEVYIATCDIEIENYAKSIQAPCIMTSDKHERCSDRTAEAMLKIEQITQKKIDIVLMAQGDEPMLTPHMIDESLKPILADPSLQITNLMGVIHSFEQFLDPNTVKVVTDLTLNALYFSREPIPSQKKWHDKIPMFKQVPLIPFRRDFLLYFNKLAPTPLEKIESVDMLRLLEHGNTIRMILTHEQNASVDTPEDLIRVIQLMENDTLMKQYQPGKIQEIAL